MTKRRIQRRKQESKANDLAAVLEALGVEATVARRAARECRQLERLINQPTSEDVETAARVRAEAWAIGFRNELPELSDAGKQERLRKLMYDLLVGIVSSGLYSLITYLLTLPELRAALHHGMHYAPPGKSERETIDEELSGRTRAFFEENEGPLLSALSQRMSELAEAFFSDDVSEQIERHFRPMFGDRTVYELCSAVVGQLHWTVSDRSRQQRAPTVTEG